MMRGELLVAVVDGQGGGMGRGLVEAVKKKWPSLHVRALGTNSLATAAMLRAGAEAIGGSEAVKILLPSQRCSIRLAVGESQPLQFYLDQAVRLLGEELQKRGAG